MNWIRPGERRSNGWFVAFTLAVVGTGAMPIANAASECDSYRLPAGWEVGQCVWYVRTRVGIVIPWSGDAGTWVDKALKHQTSGWRVGEDPVAGAIAVFDVGSYGHVAYIEDVQRDGSFTVSHCNWGGAKKVGPLDAKCAGWTDARCINGVGPARAFVSADGRLGSSGKLKGVIYPPVLAMTSRPPSSSGPTAKPNSPTASNKQTTSQYAIRIANVGIAAEATVNGRVVARINARGDTGPVSINHTLHQGDNKVLFRLMNSNKPQTYHFMVLENGRVNWEKKCGLVSRSACDSKLKNGEKSITLRL